MDSVGKICPPPPGGLNRVKTVFMLKPLEAMLPGEPDGTANRQTDIVTYRINWLRDQLSENSEPIGRGNAYRPIIIQSLNSIALLSDTRGPHSSKNEIKTIRLQFSRCSFC